MDNIDFALAGFFFGAFSLFCSMDVVSSAKHPSGKHSSGIYSSAICWALLAAALVYLDFELDNSDMKLSINTGMGAGTFMGFVSGYFGQPSNVKQQI